MNKQSEQAEREQGKQGMQRGSQGCTCCGRLCVVGEQLSDQLLHHKPSEKEYEQLAGQHMQRDGQPTWCASSTAVISGGAPSEMLASSTARLSSDPTVNDLRASGNTWYALSEHIAR